MAETGLEPITFWYRRGCQHNTPSTILNILFPIKVFRAGFNLLVDLHSDCCIS